MDLYNSWKLGKFQDLVTDDMELQAQQILKTIVKVCREIKVNVIYMLYDFQQLQWQNSLKFIWYSNKNLNFIFFKEQKVGSSGYCERQS